MISFDQFVSLHKKKAHQDHQRLGQRFVNMYIKEQWSDLFFCSDEKKAGNMIKVWLVKHQYTQQLPQVLER